MSKNVLISILIVTNLLTFLGFGGYVLMSNREVPSAKETSHSSDEYKLHLISVGLLQNEEWIINTERTPIIQYGESFRGVFIPAYYPAEYFESMMPEYSAQILDDPVPMVDGKPKPSNGKVKLSRMGEMASVEFATDTMDMKGLSEKMVDYELGINVVNWGTDSEGEETFEIIEELRDTLTFKVVR